MIKAMKKLTVYLALDLNYLLTSMKGFLSELDFIHDVKPVKQLKDLSNMVRPGISPVLLVDSAIINQNKEVITQLITDLPEALTIVVFVTGKEDDLKFYQQIQVDDYIYFNTETSEIEEKFKRIALNSLTGTTTQRNENWERLSKKTGLTVNALQVLKLVCEGHTSKEIADKLCKSKRTIDGYRRTLLQKTGAKTPSELVTYAIKNDLFPNVFVMS